MQPFEPPLRFPDTPPLPGRLGPLPGHFVVEEIPAYEPSGSGEHTFLFVEKCEQNTQDVAGALARATGVAVRDVGFAGMKDRNAVTRQWFSLPPGAAPVDESRLPSGVRVLRESRHRNKLRTGHLIANRFLLTLLDCGEHALPRAQERLELLARDGYGNYYGPQRFGRGGKNLERAFLWLRGELRGRVDEKLHSSVLQSELFNRMAARRLADPRPLLDGEVVRLRGTGSHFVVTDVAAEAPRRATGDLEPTLPMWGPKTLQSAGEARALELSVIEELGLETSDLATLAKHAPGTRRDLLVRPENVEVRAGERPEELVLVFTLPSGAFATELVRELLHTPWDAPRAKPDDRRGEGHEAPSPSPDEAKDHG